MILHYLLRSDLQSHNYYSQQTFEDISVSVYSLINYNFLKKKKNIIVNFLIYILILILFVRNVLIIDLSKLMLLKEKKMHPGNKVRDSIASEDSQP